MLALGAPLHGQERPVDLDAVLATRAVKAALGSVDGSERRAVETLIDLASVVSPSGREHDRARLVAERMRTIGLTAVAVDSVPNVTGTLRGRAPGRAIVFVAMLDDLPVIESFQRSGAHRPRRDGDRVLGPATQLQAHLAALLVAAEALVSAGFEPERDLVFAAVAREETGLQGMEALYARLAPGAAAFVEVLGDGHRIEYGAGGAIGWWRVVAKGPEGHTASGLPNVNQAIARAVDAIFSLPHPAETAINVGVLKSGEAFNRKPATGWFSLDVRARDRAAAETVALDVRRILERVARETRIRLDLVPDWQSLGGQIPGARDTLLTRAAAAISRHLGYEPELSDQGCCNLRVAVGGGTLAIGLHGDRGGGRGTADEWANVPDLLNTARQVVLLAARVAGSGPR
jgi:acetylornithine deacetylase/succinyl-diaminopimelate desuccinylase-like protein